MSRPLPLVPDEVAHLAPFVDAGVLDAAEVQLAGLLARRAPTTPPSVLLAAALAARAPRLGHVCVELDRVAASVAVEGLDATVQAALPWPEPAAWIAELEASPLVRVGAPVAPLGATEEVPPLVWDQGRLTLDRYARYERSVAADLRRRAADTGQGLVPAEQVDTLLDRFFPPAPGPADAAVPDLQRLAARAALTRRLAVVAGGPGTGKTRTVARMLAVAHTAAAAADRVLQVALVAPTGKAAARLTEAVHHEIEQVELDPGVATRMRAADALTVHRLLGWAGGIRFRHDADHPLPHDLVVVDESSMASLPLMSRLLDAVRPDAHVVLVGDPHQLASVEAGAVLGEIVRAGTSGSADRPLAGSVVVLERVHRFGATSPIAALADAIRTGRADDVLALLDDPDVVEVTRIDPAGPAHAAARRAFEGELVDAADALVRAAQTGDVDGAWAAATGTKVLTATRRGPNGRSAWQLLVESRLQQRLGSLDTGQRWYPGRPVLVTRNDPRTGLFNGDAGIVVLTPDGPRVGVAGADGWRLLEPSRLAEVETWWAMTIHKSQGSEFAHVAVALPDPPSPMLTRELLYTGVTRAKQRVTVVAGEASVRAAVTTQIPRASSLADLLA